MPLHLARSLATYPHLSLAERASVGRAALALKRLDPADPALDGVDFATWLGRHGQSARTIEALWDLVGVATLNATAPHASLGLAAMVFKTGLLSEPGAADIGWARVPLGELHDTLARKALDSAGVRTETRTKAESISRTQDGSWQVQVAGETLDAEVVVLAVPQKETYDLLPDGALDDPGKLLDIGTAPILNVHVVYDRKVLKQPFFAALGTPVQWVFDRTDSSGLMGGGQYLAISQSAADDEIDLPVAELRARYLPELEKLLPAARGAEILDFFVTRERTATFAPTPGVGRLRPSARTRADGLYLAGRVDRDRLARDHGGRRAQRIQRRRCRPRRPGPPPCSSASGGGMTISSTGTRGETVPTVPSASANPAVDTVDVTALLERGRALSTPELRAAVDRLAAPMDTVAAYHFGWIDAQGRPADGDGGKAVRPALALLSAEAAGAAAEVGVPGAVAVELVHNFSLLHDDLMDGDEQRRHRDTVWKVHGPAQAILVGDALFALANEVLLELGTVEAGRATRRLTTATRKLIDGQAQDISYEHRERVTVEECLEMEGNKTGALLACAVSIGAVLGGADDRTADTLEAYGYHLGLAFQAVDDLLGIWGDPDATGKQTWSDLRQRKKSLPVVAALAAGGPASERLGELLAADAKSNDFDSFSEAEFATRAALIEEAERPRVDLPGGPQAAHHRDRGAGSRRDAGKDPRAAHRAGGLRRRTKEMITIRI